MSKPHIKVKVADAERYSAKARIYFFVKNESVVDNLLNRRSRPYQAYRAILPTVLAAAGFSSELAQSARWSQKAGCSCGCSPGFIVDHRDVRGKDIFVDIS